jgi:hypothetical protein
MSEGPFPTDALGPQGGCRLSVRLSGMMYSCTSTWSLDAQPTRLVGISSSRTASMMASLAMSTPASLQCLAALAAASFTSCGAGCQSGGPCSSGSGIASFLQHRNGHVTLCCANRTACCIDIGNVCTLRSLSCWLVDDKGARDMVNSSHLVR